MSLISIKSELHGNLRIDNPFVGLSEMMLCQTKGGNLHYMITYNVI